MNPLNDAAVLLKFIQGESSLVANQNLRIEPAFDSVQLLAKRGGVIAMSKSVDAVPVVLVRRNSDYWSLLHQLLLDQSFMPIGTADLPEFEQYQACSIPAGYRLNFTEARALWREWWKTARTSNPRSLLMDLLISDADQWCPIHDMAYSQELLFITTPENEICLNKNDSIVWLSRRLKPVPTCPDESPVATTCPEVGNATSEARPLQQATPRNAVAVYSARLLHAQPVSLPLRSLNQELRSDLQQVLRIYQNKLYITTALGEVVVQGADLTFWLNPAEV